MIRPFIKLICIFLTIQTFGLTSAAASASTKITRINIHTLGSDARISDEIMSKFYQARKDNASLSKILKFPTATLISCEELNGLMPQDNSQTRTFLNNLITDIEKQKKIMRFAADIVPGYRHALINDGLLEDCTEEIESLHPRKEYSLKSKQDEFRENIEWLSKPIHSDPNIISLKLKYLSEWKQTDPKAALKFSPAFLSALRKSGVKQLEAIAQFAEEIAPQPSECCSQKDTGILLKRIYRKIIEKNPEVTFSSVTGISPFSQPTYFAQTILLYVMSMEKSKAELAHTIETGIIPSESSMQKMARNSLVNELGFLSVTNLYINLKAAIDDLQMELEKKLHDLPEESFIAHIIPKGKNRTATGKTSAKHALKKQKRPPIVLVPTPEQNTSYSTASSSEPISTTEEQLQTGACSSSIDTPPVVSRRTTRRKVGVTRVLNETSSLIRIYDNKNNITLALFKLETPTAHDITLCNKTHAMKLWLTSPDDALATLGYLDESHKNFTPSPAYRERMKNYHAFTELADNYVTHCGICQSYERRDGSVHQAICMPGAIYFADGSCDLGIFTYLIDPANNQVYHRMFHECTGEKIVNQYQAKGYWDLDPELGQA